MQNRLDRRLLALVLGLGFSGLAAPVWPEPQTVTLEDAQTSASQITKFAAAFNPQGRPLGATSVAYSGASGFAGLWRDLNSKPFMLISPAGDGAYSVTFASNGNDHYSAAADGPNLHFQYFGYLCAGYGGIDGGESHSVDLTLSPDGSALTGTDRFQCQFDGRKPNAGYALNESQSVFLTR